MRLPTISVAAQYEEGQTEAFLSTISFWYALHQVWVFGSMFNIEHFFGDDVAFTISASGSYSVSSIYLASIIAYLLTLVIMGITSNVSRRMLESRGWMIVAALCACVGTILTFFAETGASLSVCLASGILTGVGSATLIQYWGYLYSQELSSSSVLNTAISLPITMLIFTIAYTYLPYPAGGIFLCIIPLLELCALMRKIPSSKEVPMRIELNAPLDVDKSKIVFRLGVPLFFCGFAIGYLRSSSMGISSAENSDSLTLLLIMSSVIACAVLLSIYFVVARDDRDNWEIMFQVVTAISFICIIFAPELINIPNENISYCILAFGYFCFGGFLWSFYTSISQNYRISSILTVGAGRGTVALASAAVSLVPMFADSYWTPFQSNSYAYIALVLIFLIFGFIAMPKSKQLNAIIGRNPYPVAQGGNGAGSGARAGSDARAVVRSGSGAEARSGAQGGSDADENGVDAEVAIGGAEVDALVSEPVGAAESVDVLAEDVPPQDVLAEDVPPQDVRTVQASKRTRATDVSRQMQAETQRSALEVSDAQHESTRLGAPEAPDAQQEAKVESILQTPQMPATPSMDDLRRGCEVISKCYLLSQRETEVLLLLSLGRNSSYIQKTLYISEGTAKTHIRHIYRKTGVHKQQELIELVEEAMNPA